MKLGFLFAIAVIALLGFFVIKAELEASSLREENASLRQELEQTKATTSHEGLCKDLKIRVWPGEDGVCFVSVEINGKIYLVKGKEEVKSKAVTIKNPLAEMPNQ